MEITFGTMFNQMTGLFALLLAGYLMNRLKLFPEQMEAVVSRLITLVFLPALMLYTFMEECTVENVREYGVWMIYGGIFLLVSLAVSLILAKCLARGNTHLENIYKYVVAFPNTGGVGTPIVLALFGTAGFFKYQIFLLLSILATYTWGIAQLMPSSFGGKWTERLRGLCNPVCIAMAAGAVLGLTGIAKYLPQAIPDTLQNVGNCYPVMAMILSGFVIGDYRVREIAGDWSVYVVTAFRLVVIPCLFLAALRFFHASQMLCVMTCLSYACPSGMNTVVYPAACGEDTRPGASLILITSTLAVLTIPCIYAML